MKAFVRYAELGGIEIASPYDAGFVEALKDAIPYQERKWIAERKVWTVSRHYVNTAIAIVRHFYDEVEIVQFRREEERREQRQAPPSNGGNPSDPYQALYLLPTAPSPLIHAAYRALARIYHPDLGGDTAAMQRINAAYDKLKERIS